MLKGVKEDVSKQKQSESGPQISLRIFSGQIWTFSCCFLLFIFCILFLFLFFAYFVIFVVLLFVVLLFFFCCFVILLFYYFVILLFYSVFDFLKRYVHPTILVSTILGPDLDCFFSSTYSLHP